ncbi:MAG TPA: hypothetical protein VKX46_03690 [Ktedonobacteraceae bacterium]|nr:hypothetical protein [Ktedonobacteraceae bacterium]
MEPEQDKTGTEPNFESEVENPEVFRCQECDTALRYDAGYGGVGYMGWYCPNPACRAGGLTQGHFIPRHIDELGKWVPKQPAEPIDYEQPFAAAKKLRRLDPEFPIQEVK